MGQLLRRAVMPQQLVQVVLAEVVVVELEQRLAGLFAEPEHGPLDQRVGPFDVAQHPGRGHAVSLLAGGRVEQQRGVGVLAQDSWPARGR